MSEPIDRLRFKADWGQDMTYSHALSDITPYVRSAEWTLGFTEPGQIMQGPVGATLTLDNSDGQWNTQKAGAPFAGLVKPGVLVRIEYTDAGGTRWYQAAYKIESLTLAAGKFGQRTAVLTCTDWHADLMAAKYDPPLEQNQNTGYVVAGAMTSGALPGYPFPKHHWIMDAMRLDETTRLPDYYNDGLVVAYPGRTVLDWVGNNLDKGEGVSLYSFIEEMCYAELGGRFRFQNNAVTGTPCYVFFNRHALEVQYRTDNVYTVRAPDLISEEYAIGADLCNSVEITVYPRSTGAAGTELARMTSPIKIAGWTSRELTLRYRDPAAPEASCTCTTLIRPVATVDYTANTEADGSGSDMTAVLGVSVENRTNAVRVVLTNGSGLDLYVTLLKVRGTPMTALQAVTLTSVDALSVAENGLHKHAFTISGVDDMELVQQYADYYVRARADLRGDVRRVAFLVQEETPAALLAFVHVPLLDIRALRIVDDWLADPASARSSWVAGMRHVVDTGARTWQCTLVLEDYTAGRAWTMGGTAIGPSGETIEIGQSRLDQTTRLAF